MSLSNDMTVGLTPAPLLVPEEPENARGNMNPCLTPPPMSLPMSLPTPPEKSVAITPLHQLKYPLRYVLGFPGGLFFLDLPVVLVPFLLVYFLPFLACVRTILVFFLLLYYSILCILASLLGLCYLFCLGI